MLQHQARGLLAALLHSAAAGECAVAQRSIWAAAAAAADALSPAAAASSQQQQQQQLAVLQQQHLRQVTATGGVLAGQQQQQQQQQELPRFRPPAPVQQPLRVEDALRLVQVSARAKFPEAVEAHVRLKVDPRRGDQMVRGAAVLPHSLGKRLKVAVFAEGAAADAARAAGADAVGADELIASLLDSKGKGADFTACLATPDMMPRLVKLGRILGPKGLMPNPKVGTLTDDIAGAMRELRQGRLEFKMDRGAIVHAAIGRVAFDTQALVANLGALVAALLAAKPEAIRGGLPKYVRSVHVCSTMGRAVPVALGSLPAAMEAAAALQQQRE